jgi:hypothetical protein
MATYIYDELKKLYLFLKNNRKEAVVIACAMLFMSLHHYNPIWNTGFSDLFYYARLCRFLTIAVLPAQKTPGIIVSDGEDSKTWW